jgi:hypothetical protein
VGLSDQGGREKQLHQLAGLGRCFCSPVPVARVLARIRLLIKTDPINPMTFFWAPPQKS